MPKPGLGQEEHSARQPLVPEPCDERCPLPQSHAACLEGQCLSTPTTLTLAACSSWLVVRGGYRTAGAQLMVSWARNFIKLLSTALQMAEPVLWHHTDNCLTRSLLSQHLGEGVRGSPEQVLAKVFCVRGHQAVHRREPMVTG